MAVFIICCIISVDYLLHVQCYKVANSKHLIVAEHYTYSFPADCIALLSYHISMLYATYKC